MLRKVELTGNNQKQLEAVVHSKIHEINKALKKYLVKYENWENVDEKTKAVYKSREQFKIRVIDRLKEDRRYYVQKLFNIRQGFINE